MKTLLINLLVLASLVCNGQNELHQRTFSPDELQADIQFLFNTFEEIHPDLYHYTPKAEIDKMRGELEAASSKPMTRIDFAIKLIPIVTALKDGHTGVLLPSIERSEFVKNGGLIFPAFVKLVNGKVYIKQNLSSNTGVSKNSQVLEVNGVPIADVLERMRTYYSGELRHFRDIRVEQSFGRLYWYLFGDTASYQFKLRQGNEVKVEMVDGITYEEYRKQTKDQQRAAKPFTFKILEGTPQVGLIEFNTMQYSKRFKQFLDSTFHVIEEQSIEHLIVDIRKNGGGNSELAHDLFDYITDKPYKLFEQAEVKVSKGAKKHVKRNVKWFMAPLAYPLVLFIPAARPYFYRKNGTMKTFKQGKLRTPKKVKNKFDGKTFLLTSNYSFSSAHALANAFKCYEMGTIVGQETGGVSRAFGDIIQLQLPNTKLIAWVSHKVFEHPCNDGEVHGVLPDVWVEETLNDASSGDDVEIARVFQLIGRDVG